MNMIGTPATGNHRDDHESTAADRWIGGLIAHRTADDAARVGALVDRAIARLDHGHPSARRAHRWALPRWRTPLAAAASVVLVAGAALLVGPRPASAHAMLRAARTAESTPMDRRYSIELTFPLHPDGGARPVAAGTLDVSATGDVRLDLVMPDGMRMVRARGPAGAWVLDPEGNVRTVPGDARWPKFIETPEGDLLVDRLDALLGDIGAFYSISRCDADGELRLCAQRASDGFGGPDRIELVLDRASMTVRRAEMIGPMAPRPHGVDGSRRGVEDGPPGPHRRPGPEKVVIERADVPGGGFGSAWFLPPSPPVGEASGPPDGRGPHGPPRHDGPPPHGGPPARRRGS
jgi:hypothetical protein